MERAMARQEPHEVRNVALVGHTGTGKTMLAEAMLLAGGSIRQLGKIEDGTTVSDFLPEEKESGRSVNLGALHTRWKGKKINVLDAPGYADFAGQAVMGLAVVESALIVVSASRSVEVTTRKMWERTVEEGVVPVFVITGLDSEEAKFDEVVEALRSAFGRPCAPVTVPRGAGRAFQGVANLLSAPDLSEEEAARRQSLVESAVSSSDELLEKYLEGEEIGQPTIEAALKDAVIKGEFVPVLCVCAPSGAGVEDLLEFIVRFLPGPLEARPALAPAEDGSERRLEPSPGGPLTARVFKVMSDDYVGKVSFFRVYSGALRAASGVYVEGAGGPHKAPKLYRFQGKEQEEIQACLAGDIAATAKVEALGLGLTFWDEARGVPLAPVRLPKPMVERAVSPKSRGDEGKISDALRRLSDEDPSFTRRQDPQTKETVIAGMGERHIKIMLDRMKRRFNLEVTTRPPKIAYRETIASTADIRYRHKKQTGGAGQFAECAIRVEPAPRGEGYEFVDKIVGGSIDQPFRPSVNKGIQARMAEGIIAGYPVTDLVVQLYDGKTHPVDSKDIAFQIAGRMAIREAVLKANPVLLEPIVNMEIVVPARFTGDITGDISARRGRILGMEALGDMQVVKAKVPAAEVQTYSSQLQSLTAGEGYFTMESSHYDIVPQHITQEIIAAAKRRGGEEEK